MKRFISCVLSAVILFSAMAAISFSVSAEESSGFSYYVLSNNTAAITDYSGKSKSVAVPARIDGYTVTALSSESFAYNNEIESVVIPSSVTSIGRETFYNCEKLRTVTLPDSVTTIRSGVFSGCESLEKVVLPKQLTEIDDGLFRGCKKLSEVNIPAKVRSIGEEAFLNCESLKEINMPDTVRTLGNSAFNGDIALTKVKLSSELKKIPSEAFQYTTSLDGVSIPKNVREIDVCAFYSSGIKSVSISRYVKKIGQGAFLNCARLRKITVNKKNTKFSSAKGVLFDKKKTELITYPAGKKAKKYTTPKTAKTIAFSAFEGNEKLAALKLSKGLKTIRRAALRGTGIETVSFPKSLRTIKEEAFKNCKNLKKVTIPAGVTSVKRYAFSDCGNLRTVTFKGNSSLTVGAYAFSDCGSLKKVVYPVTKNSGGCMFFNCKKLSKVTISSKVKKIYPEDFAECPGLKRITVPASVKSIGSYALGYVNYYDGEYDKNFDLVIKGKKNSAAHKYAKKNDFEFKKIK